MILDFLASLISTSDMCSLLVKTYDASFDRALVLTLRCLTGTGMDDAKNDTGLGDVATSTDVDVDVAKDWMDNGAAGADASD
jgi:hypothetical protein